MRVEFKGVSLLAAVLYTGLVGFLLLKLLSLEAPLLLKLLVAVLVVFLSVLARPKAVRATLELKDKTWGQHLGQGVFAPLQDLKHLGFCWLVVLQTPAGLKRQYYFVDQVTAQSRRRLKVIYYLMELKKQRLW